MTDMNEEVGATTGRGEQRRRTRTALERAALELFDARGYDATSVADIAASVGVTERTFFRYFPTKDAVLFHRSRERFDLLGAALAEHVRIDPPTWPSILRALEQYAQGMEATVERIDLVAEIVYETPSLASRVRELRSLWQEWSVEVLAANGSPTRAGLVAPLVLAVLFRGQEIWVERDGEVTLGAAMAIAVDEAKAAVPLD